MCVLIHVQLNKVNEDFMSKNIKLIRQQSGFLLPESFFSQIATL